MKRLALAMITASILGGCSTGYKWDTDKNGNVYLAGTYQRFDPDKAAAISNELASGAGRFATGYAQGAADYQYTHPTVYVQPSYVVPALPQHGTATVTPTGFGSFGAPSYNINY